MTGMFCNALLLSELASEAIVSLLLDACMLFCGLRPCLLGLDRPVPDCTLVVRGGSSGIATSPPLPCLCAKDRLLVCLLGPSSNSRVRLLSMLTLLATLACLGGSAPALFSLVLPPPLPFCLSRCCFFFNPCSKFMMISRMRGRNLSKLC